MRGCRRHDARDRAEAVCARDQGVPRFVRKRVERRVACGDIGRVGGDRVEAGAGQRTNQAPSTNAGSAARVARRCAWPLPARRRSRPSPSRRRPGARGRPRARLRRCPCRGRGRMAIRCRRLRQHALDDEFRLGPRHEHVRRHLQLERPELAPPGQVGNGFAAKPAAGERLEREQFLRREYPGGIRGERGPPVAEDVRDENFRVECGGRRGALEPLTQRRDRACDAHHSSAASSSAWCSRASVSITSSRSPSMMLSRRYRVRSIRWSVRRPCGKL